MLLPTSRARRDAHASWSRARIAAQRAATSNPSSNNPDNHDPNPVAEVKPDPRLSYISFLATHLPPPTIPKLYWPEFKRLHKRAPEMRSMRPPDREKEKMFREHVARLKTGMEARVGELEGLLRGLSKEVMGRVRDGMDVGDGTHETDGTGGKEVEVPVEVRGDLRWIALEENVREMVVQKWISGLRPASASGPTSGGRDQDHRTQARGIDNEDEHENNKVQAAIRERERKVEADRRREEREIRIGKGRLREGEREVAEAMMVGSGTSRRTGMDGGG